MPTLYWSVDGVLVGVPTSRLAASAAVQTPVVVSYSFWLVATSPRTSAARTRPLTCADTLQARCSRRAGPPPAESGATSTRTRAWVVLPSRNLELEQSM
eukprot:CAMPEP_0202909058 /NCGR_PEP_ID=MMETSP1392-20130828/48148_1 /ASSEMBLY_ACC=CAM_ASM_000868 /TAXON_ID=225041 /ORGANISM="Chlamydomonas chlamydogama, Strain SAG 11-48b" /LENGTH=98 /DNA_ID=CAMNT_0049598665 /DNA_START=71 /DNA_END=367 /DNA_ORIENTATION=-